MARQEDHEERRTYFIPDNFADNTGVFGGLLRLRNFIEGIIFAAPFVLLGIWLPIQDLNRHITTVMIIVAGPLLLGFFGINGDSVTEFLMYFLKYLKKRRIARYNPRVKLEFTGDIPLGPKEIPAEKIKKMLVNLSRRDRLNETESDRYYAAGKNIAFEDDVTLEKRLRAKKAERRGAGHVRKKKHR